MAKTNKGHENVVYVGFEETTTIVLPFQPTYTCLKNECQLQSHYNYWHTVSSEASSTPAYSAQLPTQLHQPDEDDSHITPSEEER